MSEHRSAQNPDSPQGEERKNIEKAKSEKYEQKEVKEGKFEIKEGKEFKLEKPEFKEGKLEIKEHKPEKFEKPEKEGKLEKFEKFEKVEKLEIYEGKDKNDAKEQKTEKLEAKDHKPEKIETEGPFPSGPVQVDRETLLRYADALEKTGQELRHFIEQSERPDLTHGALQNESDGHDEPQGSN
jgi:hypothetical protein